MTVSRRRPLLAAFVLAGLVLALYWPAVDFKLLSLDDAYYTTDNRLVAGGLTRQNVLSAFSEFPDGDFYIPLTTVSFMADVEIFGMAPRGFHFTNILLHAFNMGLLFLLLWRMTGASGPSAMAAALVAFHPLRVESVAWITERKDVLSFLFLLLSVSSYLRFVRTAKWRWYCVLFLFAVMGMLTKPMLVTLPVLLFLLDFWPLGRLQTVPGISPRKRILSLAVEKIPLVGLSILTSVLTIVLQRSAAPPIAGGSLASRVGHSFSSDLIYLYQTLWPRELALLLFDQSWPRHTAILLPMAGVAIVTAAVVLAAGKRPFLVTGWGWYLVALLPVSGIVPSGIQWISDRFTYVPHVGLMVAIVWFAVSIAPVRLPRWALSLIAIPLILLLAILARRQLMLWKDSATFFGWKAHVTGETCDINRFVEELIMQGDYARAREEEKRILPLAGDSREGGYIQLNHLRILAGMGERKGAIEQARRYLVVRPELWETRLQLAEALSAEGRYVEAIDEYRRVLDMHLAKGRQLGIAMEGMGVALSRLGKNEEALACFNEALGEIPARASIHFNLARLLEGRGEKGPALLHYEESVRLDPGNPAFRLGMAELQVKAGAVEAAVAQMQEVARIAPGKAEAFLALGRILEMGGSNAAARASYEKAMTVPALLDDTREVAKKRLVRLK